MAAHGLSSKPLPEFFLEVYAAILSEANDLKLGTITFDQFSIKLSAQLGRLGRERETVT